MVKIRRFIVSQLVSIHISNTADFRNKNTSSSNSTIQNLRHYQARLRAMEASRGVRARSEVIMFLMMMVMMMVDKVVVVLKVVVMLMLVMTIVDKVDKVDKVVVIIRCF